MASLAIQSFSLLPGAAGTRGSDGAGEAPRPFVVGDENRSLAKLIDRLVRGVHQPQALRGLHPVLLYGPTGCGKSDITGRVAEAYRTGLEPGLVLTMSASDFRRGFAEAGRNLRTSDLRKQFGAARLVVIDDLNRLAVSKTAQEELCLVIDLLAESGGVLLATAPTPLGHVTGIVERLASRFLGGLALEVAWHGAEARAALVRCAAEGAGLRITASAATLLADGLAADPRRLLSAVAELGDRAGDRATIDRKTAQSFLQQQATSEVSFKMIVGAVSRYYRVPIKLLHSGLRKQSVVMARAVAIYLARKLTSMSYERIGQELGGRDHSTVMHNYRRVERGLAKDPLLAAAVTDLTRLLQPV